MIHKAKDLSPDQKLLVEKLLGRRVLEDEAISVRAFEPLALSDERRKEIAEELKRYFAEIDAQRKHGSADEVDAILDEAIRSVRPSFHPHR
jgi:hypothetical protein